MTFEIRWNPRPQKFLEKLPKDISLRIVEKLEKVAEDPFRFLEHYAGADVYKLRVGEYRLLIDVDFTIKMLKIRVLDHRSRVYNH